MVCACTRTGAKIENNTSPAMLEHCMAELRNDLVDLKMTSFAIESAR